MIGKPHVDAACFSFHPRKILTTGDGGMITTNEPEMETKQQLLDKDIATRRGIMNAHQEPAYQSTNWSLPRSEMCRVRMILLPLFPGMTMKNLENI